MTENTVEIKRPWEIVSKVQKKTLSVEAKFFVNEGDKPLQVFNDFSRYVLCIIENGKATTCNIPIDKMASIEKKTDKALSKYLDWEWNKPVAGDSLAYTTRFTMGTLKGKTPAEVLFEDYDKGVERLKAEHAFLKQNLEKYPKNKELMDAIMDATKITREMVAGNSSLAGAPGPMNILDIDARPLQSKMREDGMWFIYEVKVDWIPTNKYPIEVCVTNYYAPVIKDEKTKLLNIQQSKKDKNSVVVHTFNMSVDDWLDTVDSMADEKKEFNRMYKASAYKRAVQADAENRAKARRSA